MSTTTVGTLDDDVDGAAKDPLAVLNDTGEPGPLCVELRTLGIVVKKIDELPKWNVDGEIDSASYYEELERCRTEIATVLDDSMHRALKSHVPYAPAWLLAYVVVEVDETREVSYHFEPMWATLEYLHRLWSWARSRVAPTVATAGNAILHLADDLYAEIKAKNAMNCGFLHESGDFYQRGHDSAKRAIAEVDRLRGLLGEQTPGDPGFGAAAFVADWASSSMVYDRSCATAAHAVARFLDGTGGLAHVLEPLTAADDEMLMTYLNAEPFPGDKEEGQDWSELHANRLDVEALEDMRNEEWLYVDDGTIVYIYPFALRPPEGSPEPAPHSGDYYESILSDANTAVERWLLAGAHPTIIRNAFRLDDVWHGTDPDGRRFDGVRIELPKVTLRQRAGGPALATLQAELRLSKLGNHHLRFEGRLRDVSPLDMYMALLRPAPEHGALVVDFGARQWPRLANLAMKLIADLAQHLGARRTAREGMFQVLVTIDAASTRTGPAASGPRTEVTSIGHLRAAAGAPILFTPVSNVMTSLAEWSHYQMRRGNVVNHNHTHPRPDRAVIRTVNTTVHLALGAPQWELSTALSVSEFVATLEGLFACWMEQLSDFQTEVNHQRELMAKAKERTAAQLKQQGEALRTIRLSLQTFVTDCRSTIALIQSPALVRSPMVAADLAAMVAASGVARRAEEFDHRAREVLSDRLDEIIERAAKDQEEIETKARNKAESRSQIRTYTVAAITLIVGISSLSQILQDAFGLTGGRSLEIAAIAVVVMALVGVVVYASARAAHRVTEKGAKTARRSE